MNETRRILIKAAFDVLEEAQRLEGALEGATIDVGIAVDLLKNVQATGGLGADAPKEVAAA